MYEGKKSQGVKPDSPHPLFSHLDPCSSSYVNGHGFTCGGVCVCVFGRECKSVFEKKKESKKKKTKLFTVLLELLSLLFLFFFWKGI